MEEAGERGCFYAELLGSIADGVAELNWIPADGDGGGRGSRPARKEGQRERRGSGRVAACRGLAGATRATGRGGRGGAGKRRRDREQRGTGSFAHS